MLTVSGNNLDAVVQPIMKTTMQYRGNQHTQQDQVMFK